MRRENVGCSATKGNGSSGINTMNITLKKDGDTPYTPVKNPIRSSTRPYAAGVVMSSCFPS
jgi:hypothetical protein